MAQLTKVLEGRPREEIWRIKQGMTEHELLKYTEGE